ncbi:MAG: transcription termination factor NusA [Planctomycetota bacterium]
MNRDILRYVDTIHRDRQIDKEIIFAGLEMSLISAAMKKLGSSDGVEVAIDRESGDITATVNGEPLSPSDLGRIAALSGKQVLLQKIREAEREVIFAEYEPKIGQLLTGTVQSRKSGGILIISLHKTEGILPRSEQSHAETFNEGDRIKVVLAEVNMQPNRVQLLCSRAHPDLVRRLFELEIPEVGDYVVEIKAIAREAGWRTKIAVTTYDSNVDCVGACVGVKGSRIRNIVDELFGEKIDIVRWNDSIEILIEEALKPAEIGCVDPDFENKTATVFVTPDQQSLAIGRRGQNVRLASKLSGWELNITPISEEELQKMRAEYLASGIFPDKISKIESEEAEAAQAASMPSPLDKLFTTAAGDSEENVADEAVSDPGQLIESPLSAEVTAAEATAAPVADGESPENGTESDSGPELEKLPGVGKVTAERLRAAGLDSAGRIRTEGEEALAKVEGVGPKTARRIMEFLANT